VRIAARNALERQRQQEMEQRFAVRIQAAVRGWHVREQWPAIIGAKEHFDFPRRLEDLAISLPNGSAKLSAKSRAELAFVITTLKRDRQLRVRVIGSIKHTEAPPLALQRAQAVRAFLVSHEVLRRQLRVESQPVESVGGIRSAGASCVHFKVIQGLFLPRAITFREGEGEQLDARTEQMLAKVVSTLAAHPGVGLMLEGHADSSEPHAISLGLRRAQAVQRWLRANGTKVFLATTSAGAACPIAPNSTAQGRRHNRRIELHLRTNG